MVIEEAGQTNTLVRLKDYVCSAPLEKRVVKNNTDNCSREQMEYHLY
jgi:hypothetical protein